MSDNMEDSFASKENDPTAEPIILHDLKSALELLNGKTRHWNFGYDPPYQRDSTITFLFKDKLIGEFVVTTVERIGRHVGKLSGFWRVHFLPTGGEKSEASSVNGSA